MAALACGSDKALLSLADLCPELASDICETRDGCCNQPDQVACVQAQEPSCEAALSSYTAEGSLRYDAEYAAQQRAAVRPALDHCESTPGLWQFFKGGLGSGAPCERDAQCASGHCAADVHTCGDAIVMPLCSPP